MPNMADITVFKNDGTTAVVYAAQTPAGADGTDALWRSIVHPAPYAGLKPNFRLRSKWNGTRDARRLEFVGAYSAYTTNSATTISSALGVISLQGSLLLPFNIPSADQNEGVAQLTNLLTSSLVRSCFQTGFAAT